MAKFGHTNIQKIGDSDYILIPAAVKNDPKFPFAKDEKDLVIEIGKGFLKVKRYGK